MTVDREQMVGMGSPVVRDVLMDDVERWPLLLRARRDIVAAYSPKFEWLLDGGFERCNLGHEHPVRTTMYTYTQIFRQPVYGGRSSTEGLEKLFDAIEYYLVNGTAKIDGLYREMAGVYNLLGHWPRKNDHLSLVILRDLTWIRVPDRDMTEWLVELTLKAVAGKAIKRRQT